MLGRVALQSWGADPKGCPPGALASEAQGRGPVGPGCGPSWMGGGRCPLTGAGVSEEVQWKEAGDWNLLWLPDKELLLGRQDLFLRPCRLLLALPYWWNLLDNQAKEI